MSHRGNRMQEGNCTETVQKQYTVKSTRKASPRINETLCFPVLNLQSLFSLQFERFFRAEFADVLVRSIKYTFTLCVKLCVRSTLNRHVRHVVCLPYTDLPTHLTPQTSISCWLLQKVTSMPVIAMLFFPFTLKSEDGECICDSHANLFLTSWSVEKSKFEMEIKCAFFAKAWLEVPKMFLSAYLKQGFYGLTQMNNKNKRREWIQSGS